LSDLVAQLVNLPLRETSGADTALRFQYQAAYGLALILDTHGEGEDYALVFEFHDDIAVLNSASVPTSVSFYQIKTKDKGHWTLTPILKQEKSSDDPSVLLPSILGKMYANAVAFHGYVKHVAFVTNAELAFGPKKSSFNSGECSPEEQKKVQAQILKEVSGVTEVNHKLIVFKSSNLSLSDLDAHTKGKLDEFVVKLLGQMDYSLDALYRAVIDECQRKSRNLTQAVSLEDLLAARGITKADVDKWLNKVREKSIGPKWEEVCHHYHFAFSELRELRREWHRYMVEVLDVNGEVAFVRRMIRQHLDDIGIGAMDLNGLVDKTLSEIRSADNVRTRDLTDARLKVMIIYEAYS